MRDATRRRGRGRPTGSTRYAENDAALVRQVADLIVSDDKLSVTAAIKRATARPSDETLTHRLRGKMKANMAQHLREARERAEQRRLAAAQASTSRPGAALATTARGSAFLDMAALKSAAQIAAKWTSPTDALRASGVTAEILSHMRATTESASAALRAVSAMNIAEQNTALQAALRWAPQMVAMSLTSAEVAKHLGVFTKATGQSVTARILQAEQESMRATGQTVSERLTQAEESFKRADDRADSDNP